MPSLDSADCVGLDIFFSFPIEIFFLYIRQKSIQFRFDKRSYCCFYLLHQRRKPILFAVLSCLEDYSDLVMNLTAALVLSTCIKNGCCSSRFWKMVSACIISDHEDATKETFTRSSLVDDDQLLTRFYSLSVARKVWPAWFFFKKSIALDSVSIFDNIEFWLLASKRSQELSDNADQN